MALKFNIQASKEDIQKAKASAPGRYNGPLPAPGIYTFELKQLTATESRKGAAAFNARFAIAGETGDNAVYNGAPMFNWMSLPLDPSYQHYAIQVNVLDSFLVAASGGTYTVEDFARDASAGKIITEGETRGGQDIIKSIGKFKLENAKPIKIKTKHGLDQNGKPQLAVHYFITDGIEVKKSDEDDFESADSDEIEDLLG